MRQAIVKITLSAGVHVYTIAFQASETTEATQVYSLATFGWYSIAEALQWCKLLDAAQSDELDKYRNKHSYVYLDHKALFTFEQQPEEKGGG